MAYELCYSHGDLNVRNVFIRWHAADTILIDFSHVGKAPLSRDPSKLDVSLSFADTLPLMAEEFLRKVYASPLLPPHKFPRVHARSEALRQIRTQAFGDGVSNLEYEQTTVCHLLRFAQAPADQASSGARGKRKNEIWRRRILAYELACALTEAWPWVRDDRI